ncbi:juvenile hormone epoxide hydrolase-like isoform X1 [Danaus plexippus]|uniref:juvenile hormone epoxide hydrolase-like isoform X1 n=1 Tax=Danaus plexippus TaxID=13037 RepID=UPI002AAF5B5C|nr:juvenile hormone epoxide hydrolase-like isoform X1 [Danaus plexippus]
MVLMNFVTKTVVVCVVAVAGWIVMKPPYPEPPTPLDPEEWWGHEDLRSSQNHDIRPFKINFTSEMIKDLKSRLSNHRKPAPGLEGAAFTYGFNSGRLSWWTRYWSEQYPFLEREQFLNSLPQYVTNIQGLDIHFIRVKPKAPKGFTVVPLLILHGWPGSVREFYEAIPLLTKPSDEHEFVFEVIAPSLPGFGFSQASNRPGLGPYQMSMIFKNLMKRLGHEKFYIQGGDWGAVIASAMAIYYQENILGYHSNFLFVLNGYSMVRTLIGAVLPSLVVEPHLASRMYPLSSHLSFLMEESGYFHLQATKPDTIGVALSDSPAGLLAYILEKASSGTMTSNKLLDDGGLSLTYTSEQLVDNLMMYWISNSTTTASRIYAEFFQIDNILMVLDKTTTEVPTWGLQAKNEIIYQPETVLRVKYKNLLGVTTLEDGGHFVALEKPEEFARDVSRAVTAFRRFHRSRHVV